MTTFAKSPGTRQHGVAALELVLLSFLVLLPLAFGTSELGRAITEYNTIVKSARDATRYLTLFDTVTNERRAAAGCLVTHGNPTCAGAPLLANLPSATVQVSQARVELAGVGPVNLVTVTVSDYPFTSLVPVVIPDITIATGDHPIHVTMRASL